MTSLRFAERLAAICLEELPRPGTGKTALRHLHLMDVGREDLSLAKLAEAHWDATAILSEAGRTPEPKAIYGVWASDFPGTQLHLEAAGDGYKLTGTKMFCSGAGLIDRALMTVSLPERHLIDVDLRANAATITSDSSGWVSEAFRLTNTSKVSFNGSVLLRESIVGEEDWYLTRSGFWPGACGPAACWAGGAAGLMDSAMTSSRKDSHTLAHLGAMDADLWALRSLLIVAGDEIDRDPFDRLASRVRALRLRHRVDQTCSEIISRFTRAYGPGPMAMDERTSRRLQEIQLYARQCHAERDLEELGRLIRFDKPE